MRKLIAIYPTIQTYLWFPPNACSLIKPTNPCMISSLQSCLPNLSLLCLLVSTFNLDWSSDMTCPHWFVLLTWFLAFSFSTWFLCILQISVKCHFHKKDFHEYSEEVGYPCHMFLQHHLPSLDTFYLSGTLYNWIYMIIYIIMHLINFC